MTTIIKLKAALAALEHSSRVLDNVYLDVILAEGMPAIGIINARKESAASITDLKAVIAEMEAVEPVAYAHPASMDLLRAGKIAGLHVGCETTEYTLPLYTHTQPKAEPARSISTNTGHGHVWARPDGVKMRCGGAGICAACSRDAAAIAQPKVDPCTALAERDAAIERLTHEKNQSNVWLYSHCKAIGMTEKSDSGEFDHDIALFTANQKAEIESLRALLNCDYQKTSSKSVDTLRAAAQQALEALQANEDDYGSNKATITALTEALKGIKK